MWHVPAEPSVCGWRETAVSTGRASTIQSPVSNAVSRLGETTLKCRQLLIVFDMAVSPIRHALNWCRIKSATNVVIDHIFSYIFMCFLRVHFYRCCFVIRSGWGFSWWQKGCVWLALLMNVSVLHIFEVRETVMLPGRNFRGMTCTARFHLDAIFPVLTTKESTWQGMN